MTSTWGEIGSCHLCFFDVYTKRYTHKEAWSNVYISNAIAEVVDEDTEHSDLSGREIETRVPAKYGCDDSSTSSAEIARDQDALVDLWQPAAPILIKDIILMLSHYNWARQDSVPRGVVNILINTWHDLVEGIALQSIGLPTEEHEESKTPSKSEDTSVPEGPKESEEEEEGGARRMKKDKRKAALLEKAKKAKKGGHRPMTFTFSLATNRCKESGWIIRPEQPSYDELQQIILYQWALERLQAAKCPEKGHRIQLNSGSQVLLRHYGEVKTKEKGGRRKSLSPILSGGIPKPPPPKKPGPPPKKLHYRIDDGSSLIFYPSGRLAVCRSHTALCCGGFCTNVFNDSESPVILATVNAFGHGCVTDAASALIAVWDQEGGYMNDHHGSKIKEWNWLTYSAVRETVVIELSDLMTVRLHSGTSTVLIFRCGSECVHLRLPVLSNAVRPKEMPYLVTDEQFTSNFAKELMQLRKMRPSPGICKNRKNIKIAPPVKQMEPCQEPPPRWRQPGPPLRELKRIHSKVQSIVEEWLEIYRASIDIKLPGKEAPNVQLRSRLRREVQSASVRPPGRPVPKRVEEVEEEEEEEEEEENRLLARTRRTRRGSPPLIHWTPTAQIDGEFQIVQVGPLRIHSSIQLGPVIFLRRPETPPPDVAPCTAPPAFPPLMPLTVCPMLLRSALRLELLWRQRCSCSCKKMPTLTDLEYDNFLMGQPPYSQQMLVVVVTHEHERVGALEHLFRRMNKHRQMPCTQCQMDSFRLLRYTMPEVRTPDSPVENKLLEQRHNAAPGMFLMYVRGTLLFVGYLHSTHRRTVRDLEKQITKARSDYRSGQSLPSDFKYSEAPEVKELHKSIHSTQRCREGTPTSVRAHSGDEKERVTPRKSVDISDPSSPEER